MREDAKKYTLLLAIVVFAVIGIFQLGFVGRFLFGSFRVLFGAYPQVFFGLLIALILFYLIDPKKFKKVPQRIWIAMLIFIVILLNVLAFPIVQKMVGGEVVRYYFSIIKNVYSDFETNAYGGILGAIFYAVSSFLFDRTGTIIVNVFLGLVATFLLLTPQRIFEGVKRVLGYFFSFIKGFGRFLKKLLPAKDDVEVDPIDLMLDEPEVAVQPNDVTANFIDVTDDKPEPKIHPQPITIVEDDRVRFDLTEDDKKSGSDKEKRKFSNYQLPPLSLLDSVGKKGRSTANNNSAKERGKRVIEVLEQFGIEAELVDIHIGPSVTKFEIKPDSNVKISRIGSIQDNIMMELAVTSLRIEAPIPGRPAVGIEIPNEETVPVRLKEIVLNTSQFYEKENIWVALGKNLMGESISIALNKMPHLLIAGATGSGKSVSINSIISSLLISKHPEELKLVLIDPKKVEFTPYVDIPHLLTPVVTDPHQAAAALQKIVVEMEQRYETFSSQGVRNMSAYNEKSKTDESLEPMPWIVVIIDELADLMAVAGKEVETSIQRITQLARAAGIHLIVATQRPSVDVVTGVIKANIPSRIAFAVSSAVDSRTILDATGAEKLLGYGDMLYIPMGAPSPTRVQGAYVSDAEVEKLAKYASEQADPQFDNTFEEAMTPTETTGQQKGMEDELYEQALEHVLSSQRASTSNLQTYFGIGYNRAARIMHALEQQGIIGSQQGAKPREIFYESLDAYQKLQETE